MPSTGSSSGNRNGVRTGAFVAIAIALHAAFLLLPLATDSPVPGPETVVEIELLAQGTKAKIHSPTLPRAGVEPEVDTEPEPIAEPESGAEPESTAVLNQDNQRPRVTVARLLEQAANSNWSESVPPRNNFVRSTESALYKSLRRPVLPIVANLFDDYVLPVDVEIVDRWLEPGGTHKVVIRTPTGDVLCGRQEPVDEFRPWTQMPMMFNICGGGGKR